MTLRSALGHHVVFLILIALACLSVCLSTFFVLDRQYRAALASGLELSAAHSRAFEEHLTRSLESIQRLADFIAAGTLPPEEAQVGALFGRLLRQTPFLRSLSMVDGQGRILASSQASNIGRSVDLNDFFPYTTNAGGPLLRIGRPWFGRDVDQGRPTAVDQALPAGDLGFLPILCRGELNGTLVWLVAVLNPDYFINYFSQWLDPAIGVVEILRYDRLVLLSTGDHLHFGQMHPDLQLAGRLQESEIGSFRSSLQQMPSLSSYRASRQYPLVVVTHVFQARMLADWWRECLRTVVLVIMLLVILLYLATSLYRREQRIACEREAARRREYERLAATVFETVLEAVVVTDAEQRIIAVNPAFSRITGYAPEEAIGRDFSLLASGYHADSFFPELWQALALHGHWEGEVRNRRKSGEIFVAWLSINQVHGDGGEVVSLVTGFSDITEYCAEAERISHLAHHDLLTGLPNRALFMDRLCQGMLQSHRERSPLGLIFFDLDKFKPVNDSLGHPVGDLLLQALAERLGKELRASDTLARLGGDEFVLLLPTVGEVQDALTVAEKIRVAVAQAFFIEGHRIHVTASIGVALYPDHAADGLALLHCADRAMYRAKADGGNCFVLYEQETPTTAEE